MNAVPRRSGAIFGEIATAVLDSVTKSIYFVFRGGSIQLLPRYGETARMHVALPKGYGHTLYGTLHPLSGNEPLPQVARSYLSSELAPDTRPGL